MKKIARTRLVEAHLPLVRHLAARMLNQALPYLEMDDLIAIGAEALLRAAERYDPTRGVPFGTFAYLRVRGAMYEGLGVVGPLTRGVVRRRRGRPERRSLPRIFRFDERHTGAVTDGEDLEDDVASAIDAARLRPQLTVALEVLDERDRELILRHYFSGDTLCEIGRDMGRSKSWASRVHTQALTRLRAALAFACGPVGPAAECGPGPAVACAGT